MRAGQASIAAAVKGNALSYPLGSCTIRSSDSRGRCRQGEVGLYSRRKTLLNSCFRRVCPFGTSVQYNMWQSSPPHNFAVAVWQWQLPRKLSFRGCIAKCIYIYIYGGLHVETKIIFVENTYMMCMSSSSSLLSKRCCVIWQSQEGARRFFLSFSPPLAGP